MKKILLMIVSLGLFSCSEPTPTTNYSSCKITSSSAQSTEDEEHDLKQCWDGADYESKSDALSWCEDKVTSYIENEYNFTHSTQFTVKKETCG